jgi:hypothetical protein
VREIHFKERHKERDIMCFTQNGENLSVPLKYLSLKSSDVATKMMGEAKYLCQKTNIRESVDSKSKKQDKEEYDRLHTFSTFLELKTVIGKHKFDGHYTAIINDNAVLFLHILEFPMPKIENSIAINKELQLSAYFHGIALNSLCNICLPFQVLSINNITNILAKLRSLKK